MIEDITNYINDNELNIAQMVVYKNDSIVYNESFLNHKIADSQHVMSVTKSIVSILVGIAIDQGLIKSIDDYVLDYFPEYKIKRGEKVLPLIKLRHLLTMTAPYKYKSEPWTKICTSPDWTIAALDYLGGTRTKLGEYRYSTLGIHILTGIISRKSNMATVDYANKYLFEPLGLNKLTDIVAENASEHKEFTISKLPRSTGWFVDPKRVGTAGYGLCISAYDLAIIGLMLKNKGVHNNKRIVSEEWISISTKAHYKGDIFGGEKMYGFLWWIIDEKENIYAAIGNSGNMLYIDNDKNIVVAITAVFKPTVMDRIDFIRKFVVPRL